MVQYPIIQMFPKIFFNNTAKENIFILQTLTGRAEWPKDPKAVSISNQPQEQSQQLQAEEAGG